MPVVRLSTAPEQLELAVGAIERKAKIVAVVPQGEGAVLVFTESKASRAKAPARETR